MEKILYKMDDKTYLELKIVGVFTKRNETRSSTNRHCNNHAFWSLSLEEGLIIVAKCKQDWKALAYSSC